MSKLLVINEEQVEKIKRHYLYADMATDHPELFNEEDRKELFQQWRGMYTVLRNLGLLDLVRGENND